MNKHLAFALAVLVQLAIVLFPSAEKIALRSDPGLVIQLKTGPVDPYDAMRGYYMTLRYEISAPPGFEHDEERAGETVFTLLEQGEDGIWHARSCTTAAPVLEPRQRMIEGWVTRNQWKGPVLYGIEKYYVPETMRKEIEDAIRAEQEEIVVDVAVDDKGRSAVLRLHVGGKTYEY